MSRQYEYSMPFGKYKGCSLQSIPTDYLEWLHTEADLRAGYLRDAVAAELKRRDYENQQQYRPSPKRIPAGLQLETALKLIEEGRRSLARKHHPDREGGDTATMQAVNLAADFLLETLPDLLGARR